MLELYEYMLVCVCACACIQSELDRLHTKTEHEKFFLAGEETAGYERGRKSEE